MNGWSLAVLIVIIIIIVAIAAVVFYFKFKFKVNKYKIVSNVANKKTGGIMPEDLGDFILGCCGSN